MVCVNLITENLKQEQKFKYENSRRLGIDYIMHDNNGMSTGYLIYKF